MELAMIGLGKMGLNMSTRLVRGGDPLDTLAAARFPKLVVSRAHHPAFEAICDVLERELRAERLVLEGYGRTVQLHPVNLRSQSSSSARRAADIASPPTPEGRTLSTQVTSCNLRLARFDLGARS